MRLHGEIFKLGRAQTADVVLEDSSVADAHAILKLDPEGWVVVDLGSGETFVNGSPVSEGPVRAEDVLRLGKTRLRLFEDGMARLRDVPVRVKSTPTGPQCPRCGDALPTVDWVGGMSYRSADRLRYQRCASCKLSVISRDTLRERFDLPAGTFGGTELEVHRRPTKQHCPACLSPFAALTLMRMSTWVEIEECAACGTIALDDGEGALLQTLLAGDR